VPPVELAKAAEAVVAIAARKQSNAAPLRVKPRKTTSFVGLRG
jgi:hypothetical protein